MEMKANQLPQKLTRGNVTNAKTTAANLKLERITIIFLIGIHPMQG